MKVESIAECSKGLSNLLVLKVLIRHPEWKYPTIIDERKQQRGQ